MKTLESGRFNNSNYLEENGEARGVLQRGKLIFEMIFVIAFLMVEALSLEN